MVATSEGTFFFQPEEIVRLEASSNYTYIHFTNRKKLFTAKVLKEFAILLEPMGFIRTHRTHLLNRNYISYVSPQGKIMMQDSSMAEVSRRLKREVMRSIKNMN
jgi:two-component system, LytTR family, response regulator